MAGAIADDVGKACTDSISKEPLDFEDSKGAPIPCLLDGRIKSAMPDATGFLDFHDEEKPCLDKDFSVYGTKNKRTWLIKILYPFFFFVPYYHLRRLENLYVDDIVRRSDQWNVFRSKFNSDCKQHVLYGTILLSADLALLIFTTFGSDKQTSDPARGYAFISLLVTLQSIFLGHHQPKGPLLAEDGKHVFKHNGSQFGLELLAITYSAPYLSLILGVAHFLVSITKLCFRNPTILTKSLVAIFVVVVMSLMAFCVHLRSDDTPAQNHVYLKASHVRQIDDNGGVSRNPTLTSEASESISRKSWGLFGWIGYRECVAPNTTPV